MQGQKDFHDKLSLCFCLCERVSKHHFYRRLRDLLDWEFLRAQTRSVYSHTGQPSLDPVVFLKLVLVGSRGSPPVDSGPAHSLSTDRAPQLLG